MSSSEERILKGRYRLGKMIGAGGMSIVYRALDLETMERVAVKTLRPEYMKDVQFLRQFRKETQIVNQYQHRNIVRTLDNGEEDGILFIVMEYVEGQTLKEYIERNAPLSHEKAVDICAQICDALFYSHSHHLIHRDIKPQNILLTEDGTVKVTDFGIARIAQPSNSTTVNAQQAVGSVHYSSPEQVRGRRTTARSDIYSAGCVLYEMVTGHLPFEGDSAVSVALKQLNDEPVLPGKLVRGLAPSLEQVILKAMEKDPDCRYVSAREMDNDLRRSLREPQGTFVVRTRSQNGRTAQTLNLTDMPVDAHSDASREGRVRDSASPNDRKLRQEMGRARGVIWLQVILSVLLTAGLACAVWLLLRIGEATDVLQLKPVEITVPYLVGLGSNEAQQALADKGLHSSLSQEPSYDVPKGEVISQMPEANETVSQGSAISVIVSSGLPQESVPDCFGLSLEEAQARLETYGFVLGEVVPCTDETVPAGCIARQDPSARTLCDEGSVVDLWMRSADKVVTFPMENLVGLTLEEAEAYLSSVNLSLGEVQRIPTSSYSAGVVVQQDPTQKMTVAEGMEIDLWVSNGLSTMYKKSLALPLTLEKDSALIEVIAVLDEGNLPIFQQTLSSGEHTLAVSFETQSEGTKTLIVLEDGEEMERITVEVTAGEE